MGAGIVYSPGATKLHAELETWLQKARDAAVGQKVTGVEALSDGSVIISFENAKALVLIRPEARAIGEERGTFEGKPPGS